MKNARHPSVRSGCKAAVAGALILALSACATPETRVRTGLRDAGLSEAMASCMAERMVDRLSLLQLRRLGSLGSLDERPLRDLTLDQFLYKVRALKDPEILSVTTTSAGVCAFR